MNKIEVLADDKIVRLYPLKDLDDKKIRIEIKSIKGSILSKLISLIYFLCCTSSHLTVLSKPDLNYVNSTDLEKGLKFG